MIFTQHYLDCLSQGSYLIGDGTTGRAVVVDPRRDIDDYLSEAAEHGLRIERVIETHIHADFLSGHLELAAATGALISYGEDAEVEFPIEPLRDGQRISLGQVTLEILARPGHTPESICIVVYENADDEVPLRGAHGRHLVRRRRGASGSAGGQRPVGGDVGPDAVLVAARQTSEAARRFAGFSRAWGRIGVRQAASSETSSTIGEQRRTNYALQMIDADQFVAALTEDQPPRPRYFEFDSLRNREQHPLLDGNAPALMDIDDVCTHARAGAILLDSREPADYASGHLRGAVNVGLRGRFAESVGIVLSPDRDIVLVGDPALAQESKTRLARVGFDRVIGQLRNLPSVFTQRPDLIQTATRLTGGQLAELRSLRPGLQLVDVRNPGETVDGVIPGAREIPLPALTDSIASLDQTAPVVAYCASGYRSLVAASVLRASGFDDVSDLVGGYGAWQAAGAA